jgi:hypothetical protein
MWLRVDWYVQTVRRNVLQTLPLRWKNILPKRAQIFTDYKPSRARNSTAVEAQISRCQFRPFYVRLGSGDTQTKGYNKSVNVSGIITAEVLNQWTRSFRQYKSRGNDCINWNIKTKQRVLWRTNHIISCDTTRMHRKRRLQQFFIAERAC